MAKIISLYNTPGNTQLAHAAWNFVCAALWPDQQFTPTEIKEGMYAVGLHLAGPGSPRKRFITFCERVLLAAQEGQKILPPATWLHFGYPYGYANTKAAYTRVIDTRKTVPGYLLGISLVANFYWNRISHSPTASFERLRSRLLRLQGAELFALCCRALAFQCFLKPNNLHHGA